MLLVFKVTFVAIILWSILIGWRNRTYQHAGVLNSIYIGVIVLATLMFLWLMGFCLWLAGY